jgi:hypothetical protein
LSATPQDLARLRQAVHVVLRNLADLSADAEVVDLSQQCQQLLGRIERWGDSPPSQELCEEAIRALVSIHLRGLRARMRRSQRSGTFP